MQWRNSSRNYGLTSILLHWGVALTVVGLFALGLWMRGLNYYSQWYRTAPDIHKSVGLILLAVMVLRLVWRWLSPPPAALPTHTPLVRLASTAGHLTLYAGLFVVMLVHAAHRFRYTLYDGLQIKHRVLVGALCYGAVLVGAFACLQFLGGATQ